MANIKAWWKRLRCSVANGSSHRRRPTTGRGEIRFYVDGVLQERAPFAGNYEVSLQPLLLGQIPTRGASPRSSFAAEFGLKSGSRRPRYDGDFTPGRRHEPDADTIALYHCDEGAGGVLQDASAYKHDGRVFNAGWTIADGPLPKCPQ